jgi:uncharacterized protein YkwD
MKSSYKIMLILFVCLFFKCSESRDIDKTFTTLSFSPTTEDLQLFSVLNNYHIKQGLPVLTYSDHMSALASNHNDYMIKNDTVDHSSFDYRASSIQYVLHFSKISECIAYGYSTPESIVNAWLKSPRHKAVLDAGFTHVGVSITKDSINTKYVTVIFAK